MIKIIKITPFLVTPLFSIERGETLPLIYLLIPIFIFLLIMYTLWKRNREAYFLLLGCSLTLYKEKRALEEKREALENALADKELLLRELNHRVKNSIQTIVSFLRLQIHETEERHTQQILKNIENRILSISHLYALLYTKENICFVDTHEYFSLLIEDIETSYAMPHINIVIKSEINIPSEYAIYCGFILNESVSNSLQHAFNDRESGEILIHLTREEGTYRLSLSDNGTGYTQEEDVDSLGLIIVETLVETQLQGKLSIESTTSGTKINIEWKENE